MTKDEYEKVYQHINQLSQKHALGKIDDKTMYEGMKKLLEELIAEAREHSVRTANRRAFGLGFVVGAIVLAGLVYAGFALWQMDWFREWAKGLRP